MRFDLRMYLKHRKSIASTILIGFFTINLALTARPEAPTPPAASTRNTWAHISALPPSTHMHVAAENGSKTCFLVSSDEEKLVCSKGKNSSGSSYTFTRAEVKSVKLTRYGRSTLFGLLIGGGVGTGVGAIVGQVKHPNNPQAFLDFSGLSRDADIVIGAAVGLGAGGGIGGPTDFLRGPTIYLRQGASH